MRNIDMYSKCLLITCLEYSSSVNIPTKIPTFSIENIKVVYVV